MREIEEKTSLKKQIEEFISGNSRSAHKFLGCHKKGNGFVFRVWAPHAKSVSVHGDFNAWDKNSPKMTLLFGGIWESYVENAAVYDNYQYYIEAYDGSFLYKSDPYAFHTSTRPETASKVYDISDIRIEDKAFRRKKKNAPVYKLSRKGAPLCNHGYACGILS